MKKLLLSLGLSILAISGPSMASENGVSVNVEVLSETPILDSNGAEILARKPLEVATPDQTVIYKITIRNSETETVRNVALNIPVSDSLVIKPDSFTSDIDMDVTFSAGADFFPFENLMVAEKDTSRQARPEDIASVRIDIRELPQDETYFVEYDAIVK